MNATLLAVIFEDCHCDCHILGHYLLSALMICSVTTNLSLCMMEEADSEYVVMSTGAKSWLQSLYIMYRAPMRHILLLAQVYTYARVHNVINK